MPRTAALDPTSEQIAAVAGNSGQNDLYVCLRERPSNLVRAYARNA